jgi:Domain of unknown function (DUF4399)
MRAVAIAAVALASIATYAWAQERTPSPAGAEVYIISPKDGATVKSPVTVEFGLKGMGVAPAGVKFENTGHHHLLIDTDIPADQNAPLPTSDNVRHFGKGQTEASIELKPGKHTLQLVLGDDKHTPHNPPVVSKKITITVK